MLNLKSYRSFFSPSSSRHSPAAVRQGDGSVSPSPSASPSTRPRSMLDAELIENFAFSLLGIGLLWHAANLAAKHFSGKKRREEIARKVREKMELNGRKPFEMDEFEAEIAADMVYPSEIDVALAEIGGLERVKRQVFDLVALPLKRPDLFVGRCKLLRPPKGILLYGPPGTGKTMLAKAIAKESGAAFIDLKMSTTMNMWFGESQKLIRATFSLAWKLSPCIIFIDEIDAFLRDRSSSNHSGALQSMQAEFMALWDGISSNDSKVTAAYGIIIIGATNRPYDIDKAILRRMPRQFKLDLPNAVQRRQILEIILKDEDLEQNVWKELSALAGTLENYSGSDIKELCRVAAARPLEDLSRRMNAKPSSAFHEHTLKLRQINLSDFYSARDEVKPTGVAAEEYFGASHQQGSNPPVDMQQLMQWLQALNLLNGGYKAELFPERISYTTTMRRKAAEVAQSLTKSELEQAGDDANEDEGEAADATFTLPEAATASTSASADQSKSGSKAKKPPDILPTKRGGAGGIYLSDEEEEKEANQQSPTGSSSNVDLSSSSTSVAKSTANPQKEGASKSLSKVDALWQSMQEGSGSGGVKRVRNRGGITGLAQLMNKKKKKKRKKTSGGMDSSMAFLLRPAKRGNAVDKEALKRAAKEALSKTGKMKVKESVKFAGAVVSVDRVIDKASEEAQAKAKAEAAEAKKSMLDRVVDEIGTKKKISSLTKSSYDWDKFKQDKGIADDLEKKAAEDSYVEKQQFLQRVDQRQFELEKEERNRQRAEREAKEKQSGR